MEWFPRPLDCFSYPPPLSFLSLFFFLEKCTENHQKARIFYPYRTLKSLEKKGKTLKKTRKSSQEEKTRNSKKTRKGRTGPSPPTKGPSFRTVFSTESDSVVFYYSVVNLLRIVTLPQGPCHIKNTTVILIHYSGRKKYDGSKTIRQGL